LTPFAEADNAAVVDADTADTVAVKLAEVAPAATVMEAGTATAEALLARLTANPPVGAAVVRMTEQTSEPEPVIAALEQVRACSAAMAFNCTDSVLVAPPAVAVTVAVCVVVTADTDSVKLAEDALFATDTDDGTVTAASLLLRLTATALVAAEVRVTEQELVPAPVNAALLQDTDESVGAAAAFRLMEAVTDRRL
jgi:hypothetical protein